MSTANTTHDVVKNLNELLNEEKWTRATLNNYTVANFEDLDEIVDSIEKNDLTEEVREICEEHLQHTKNSIIALYIAGLLDLARQSVDDANLILLTKIFSDNHKWNIVEYLAQKILEFGENRFALRILADVYDNDNQAEKLHDVWERLIRVDFEEADIVRRLAELREEEGETDQAIEYYKKALHRFITKKNFNTIRDTWHKLVELSPGETEFFYHAESKIARTISTERAIQLLEDLFPVYKKQGDWDKAIELLKRVLNYDPKIAWARKEIIECFENKYADHSNLEEYIRVSNINQSWRPVHEAIADFEKHISFDKGNFVFHRSWGIGRIRDIAGDNITIDFAKKRGHSMSLKMAINALDVLPKDHIWVLRAVWKREKLRKLVKDKRIWALKTVIRSLGNAADMKKIKAELVPAILTPGEWSSWSTKAREELKTNPDFGTLPDKADHFVVRDQPISFEEKTFNKFRADKTFFDRVKTLEEFLDTLDKDASSEGIDSEFFREMFEYFAGYLRNIGEVNEYVISSALVVREIVERFPFLRSDLELDFAPLYEQIENVEEVFSNIDSTDLRKKFLAQLRGADKDWGEVYARLLPIHLSREVLLELERHGKRQLILDFISRVYENYRDMRETFVWLVKNCDDDPWFDELGLTEEKRLIAMVHIYDLTFRDIDNKKDVSYNRKINKQVQNHLFKDNHLPAFVESADEESVSRIFTLISDVKEMDQKQLLDLRTTVQSRFPDFHFYGDDVVEQSTKKILYCTGEMYNAKQAEYKHLQEVEVPQNSKEIETAREYGDLKENAEYKAAKERQESLSNRAGRLKTELEQARIVKPKDVNTDEVSFGTKVSLKDLLNGGEIVYSILGPWESNPSAKVINYQSPLGKGLLKSKAGEELDFEINETRYHVLVEKIELADF